MDEPCSALDPIATSRIEDLMVELKREFTIVIVTHNMQQAARVSDMTAFFTTEVAEDSSRVGRLVEFDRTADDLHQPVRSAHRGLHHRPVRMSLRTRDAPAARLRSGERADDARRARPPTELRASSREALHAVADAVIVVDADGDELLRNEAARAVPRRPAQPTRSPRSRSTSCSTGRGRARAASGSSSSSVRPARCSSSAPSRCSPTARSSARWSSSATSPRPGARRPCAATSSPT